eukprot:s928_g4.t3
MNLKQLIGKELAHLRWREACALQKKLCDLQTSGAQKPKTLQEFPDLQEEMIMLHTWKFRTKERMRSLLWRQQGLRKLGKPSSDALRAFAGRCCAEGTLTGDWRRCHDVCCILGGSGAGKSTLLNVLAGRQLTSRVFHIDGELRVNGRTVEPWRLRPRVAYVMQKDEFFATETPREAILFSARLRLPASHLSVLEEKGIDSYIGQLLDSLGLSQCCDRRIGGASLNGISNGERKRVSIGVELITRPSIVFLDEPTLGLTTGLDSFSAWQVMRIVKDLADSGCTVVCTIHQPSSERAETDGVWPQHPVRWQRLNVTVDGLSVPIGIASANWNSVELVSKIFGILVSEVVGYHVVDGLEQGSAEMIYRLSGCPPSMKSMSECWKSPRRFHFALETWEDTVTAAWDATFREMGQFAPVNLGSGGYAGFDGMYILERARAESQANTGILLTYYSNFNATWFHPETYCAQVRDILPERVLTCSEAVNLLHPEYGQEYLDATGDLGGIEDAGNGSIHLKCWQDRWWVAPSCRTDAERCVGVLTSGAGWGTDFMIQQAFWHNMPLAFATAISEQYISVNREFQSVLYWWTPDETFVLQKGMPLVFPPHSVSEYKAGIYASAPRRRSLFKWSAAGMDIVADRAYGLAENLNIGESDISNLLLLHAQNLQDANGTVEIWDTACQWLKENTDAWKSWVPDQTVCAVGKGLVNLQGNFVMQREQAVNCGVCPPGFASQKEGATRVCAPCEPGFYQNSFRASSCTACELGSITSEPGSVTCTPCSLGSFANRSGQSSCHRCGSASSADEWTTSLEVTSGGSSRWIQVQGASSADYCACVQGTFLFADRCKACTEGANCPGSNQLEVLPGYFSTREAPGDIFQCRAIGHCPGGEPGTCAEGRDPSYLGCSKCLQGLRSRDDGSCGECRSSDYAVATVCVLLLVAAVALVYVVLFKEQQVRQPGPLLITLTSITQLLTTLQILNVLGSFDILWGEPFISILAFIELFKFNLDILSIDCVTWFDSVGEFTMRVCLLPTIMLIALCVHFGFLGISYLRAVLTKTEPRRGCRFSQLLRTVGTMLMIFFIMVFALLTEPFQCRLHPSGVSTLKGRYQSVYCDGQGEHLQMYITGALGCLIPISFLALCTWVVVVEIPKGIASVDTTVLDAYFFLIRRLRPGAEIFSILFQVRNLFVVLCPLVPSITGKLLSLGLILSMNLILVVHVKPWRSAICNVLDVVLLCGMLGIMTMAAMFVKDVSSETNIWIVMVCFGVMMLGIFGAIAFGVYKSCRQKYQKQFKFFLCHHKAASGCMARLLKIELQQRLPRSKTFVDCDDLMNLTRLFGYVGQDTETFVILGSPAIFTRKWCVGEMVTAQVNGVRTVLVAWPTMVMPDEQFILNYRSIVPEIKDLTKFGINLLDVKKTLRWLGEVETLWLPSKLTDIVVRTLVSSLAGTRRRSELHGPSFRSPPGSSEATDFHSRRSNRSDSSSMLCPIMVDPKNIEAVAAAFILQALLRPLLLNRLMLPDVLKEDMEVPQDTRAETR